MVSLDLQIDNKRKEHNCITIMGEGEGGSYHLHIPKLVLLRRPHILGLAHMRHIAPVIGTISVVGRIRGVEDETVDALAIESSRQIVDVGAARRVPVQVHLHLLAHCDGSGNRKGEAHMRHYFYAPHLRTLDGARKETVTNNTVRISDLG